MSSTYLGIYRNNHHRYAACCERSWTVKSLRVNLPVIIFPMAIPALCNCLPDGRKSFYTMGLAVVAYGVVLLMVPSHTFYQEHSYTITENEKLAKAFWKGWKGKLSMLLYSYGIIAAFFSQALSLYFYAIVAVICLYTEQANRQVIERIMKSQFYQWS